MAAPAQPVSATHRPANPYHIAAYYMLAVVALLAVGIYDTTDAWNWLIVPVWITLIGQSFFHIITATEIYVIHLKARRDRCEDELKRRHEL